MLLQLLAERFSLGTDLSFPSHCLRPIGPELRASARRGEGTERVQALPQSALELIGSHGREATPSKRRPPAGVSVRVRWHRVTGTTLLLVT